MLSRHISPVIIIPVYNGRDSLLRLLIEIKEHYKFPIIIVDDGSEDGLTEQDVGEVQFLQHSANLGKGAALKSGLTHAKHLGYSHALTLDADGQHSPEMIPDFLKHVKSESRIFVIGDRDFRMAHMPLHRKLSNNITSLILSLRSGVMVRDSQVGYRCYPLGDSRLWDSCEDGFQFESAVLFNAAKLNLQLKWQPIPVIYGDEASHMNLTKDTLRFIRTFLRSFKW